MGLNTEPDRYFNDYSPDQPPPEPTAPEPRQLFSMARDGDQVTIVGLPPSELIPTKLARPEAPAIIVPQPPKPRRSRRRNAAHILSPLDPDQADEVQAWYDYLREHPDPGMRPENVRKHNEKRFAHKLGRTVARAITLTNPLYMQMAAVPITRLDANLDAYYKLFPPLEPSAMTDDAAKARADFLNEEMQAVRIRLPFRPDLQAISTIIRALRDPAHHHPNAYWGAAALVGAHGMTLKFGKYHSDSAHPHLNR